MSEKKQQVRVNGEWFDIVQKVQRKVINAFPWYVEYSNNGSVCCCYAAEDDLRDAPAEPTPPSEVWVNVYEDGDIGAAWKSREECIAQCRPVPHITRRYVLEKPERP